MKPLLTLLFAAQVTLAASQYRVGMARMDITPELPVWLTGYAVRTHPANHVLQRLWAKSLAVQDGKGGRIVIVTTDLLGLPPQLAEEVAARCRSEFGLKREQLWLNSSHTHSGPVVWPNLRVIFDFNPEEQRQAEEYARHLADQLVMIVGQSLHHQSRAQLSFGTGEAGFAINRRIDRLRSLNPGREFPAPVDHSVPVIGVRDNTGKLLALLFGYACHNTTTTGEFYEVSGDYAGYAQLELEKAHPGTQAMFVMLCGGDQNPSPRSQLAYVQEHGSELAEAVEQVLTTPMTALTPRIRTAISYAELPLAVHKREDFEAETHSSDIYHRRRAQLILKDYESSTVARSESLPVQAIRLGGELTLLTLGGEVVVDYAARVKREYQGRAMVVAGYSNGTVSYIPSERVLQEGGYEAFDSIVYYGLPAPYATGVEDRLFQVIRKTLSSLGVQPAR